MNDLIDRMNVYYEIVDYFHEKGYLFEEVNGILENDIEDIIMEAPTVASSEPVRHGRWNEAKDHTLWCSVCLETAPYVENHYGDVIWAERYNYCPRCGAKMDGK